MQVGLHPISPRRAVFAVIGQGLKPESQRTAGGGARPMLWARQAWPLQTGPVCSPELPKHPHVRITVLSSVLTHTQRHTETHMS